ncbi:relaxase/mobilization nuclease domain-containing protein [Ruminococcus flavefaciens]|uniref:relaxase/mobilization nuclease domain-containing protein n=1 Tax=Ruminococcus flavefaciens TaxID=1265 RepID=UPI0013D9F580|nr:relaxase/mobilization nuclease domain-containing protein [Ruminococcus flavefaciens]
MSKLNTFAAVLKFINGANNTPDALRAICVYTTDTAKTNGGTLIATQGCSSEHPVEDMLSNKRLHNKTHGKQYEHFVLAPCPNGSDKSPEDVLKAVKEIVATVFPENMAVITVHTDTKVVHAHTVLDAVNAVTGRKFSQGPADLNRVKQKANNILKKHGFEIITASANEFVDHTDYSNEAGFDFIELNEEEFITGAALGEVSAYTDSVSLDSTIETISSWDYFDCDTPNYFGGNNMNNNYSPYAPQTQAMPVATPTVEIIPSATLAVQPAQDTLVPAPSVEAVPTAVGTVGNSFPTTSVVTGPIFRIKGTPDSNFAGLNELVEQTAAYAQEHQREAANLALAMNQYAQQSGYPSNVSVYAGPIFDIDMTGGIYPPLPGYDGNK